MGTTQKSKAFKEFLLEKENELAGYEGLLRISGLVLPGLKGKGQEENRIKMELMIISMTEQIKATKKVISLIKRI